MRHAFGAVMTRGAAQQESQNTEDYGNKSKGEPIFI
jgi:hypothetical protein